MYHNEDLTITLCMPDWAEQELNNLPPFLPTVEQQMEAVLTFVDKNMKHGTGGPFAAGVFERDSGKLISIGVNRVVPSNCSSIHAEIMALTLAQKRLATYDLGGEDMAAHQLVVNWCPCVMCFGALLWSGVRSLVIAGSGPELEEVTGFDEGPLHPNWRHELEKRNITLTDNVLNEKAIAQFKAFATSDQPVYNARQG